MKVLYLLHTDWNWVKQRSQFLAENLSRIGCDVTVAYKFSLRRSNLVKNESTLRLYPCPFLPFKLKAIFILNKIDRLFWKTFFEFLKHRHKYDQIVVTHPLLASYVDGLDLPIIYDCHDDNSEFYANGRIKNDIDREHEKLINIASLNIFSSEHLHSKYCGDKKSLVIRNGHSCDLARLEFIRSSSPMKSGVGYNLFYFGTVSEWFDNNLILKIVNDFQDVCITIIGPCDSTQIKHSRIKYIGPMNHKELMDYSSEADAFIMPFLVNELILGVDPVKLYEYLSFSAAVFSVYYPELDHFKPLIKFYETHEEAISLIRDDRLDRSIHHAEFNAREKFLIESSWISRAKDFKKSLLL